MKYGAHWRHAKEKRPVFPVEKISNVKLFLLNGLVRKKEGEGKL